MCAALDEASRRAPCVGYLAAASNTFAHRPNRIAKMDHTPTPVLFSDSDFLDLQELIGDDLPIANSATEDPLAILLQADPAHFVCEQSKKEDLPEPALVPKRRMTYKRRQGSSTDHPRLPKVSRYSTAIPEADQDYERSVLWTPEARKAYNREYYRLNRERVRARSLIRNHKAGCHENGLRVECLLCQDKAFGINKD